MSIPVAGEGLGRRGERGGMSGGLVGQKKEKRKERKTYRYLGGGRGHPSRAGLPMALDLDSREDVAVSRAKEIDQKFRLFFPFTMFRPQRSSSGGKRTPS
jgi:hypothetical protein